MRKHLSIQELENDRHIDDVFVHIKNSNNEKISSLHKFIYESDKLYLTTDDNIYTLDIENKEKILRNIKSKFNDTLYSIFRITV
jgi:hypothetical protein